MIFHEGKQTLTPAQAQGILSATGDSIVIMDSDLQHAPETIPSLLRSLEDGASVAIASRYVPGGSPGPRPVMRAIISRAAEIGAKFLLRSARNLSDPISGFFAFDRAIYQPINPRYRGYKLLLFVLAMARGAKVAEEPFRFSNRTNGHSKIVKSFGFIRVFATEAVLARRMENALRRRKIRSSPSPRHSGWGVSETLARSGPVSATPESTGPFRVSGAEPARNQAHGSGALTMLPISGPGDSGTHGPPGAH